ncbi:MAG: hypothetical protein K6A98_03710 [Prevotella sp.]|nr:hypothetical protein [Prevotella sp.]
MKKLIIGLFALCLGLGMVSCNKEVNKEVNVQDVVAKAKAEGANWDEAQWKQAFKDMMTGLKPLIDKSKEIQAKINEAEKGDDAAKLAAVGEIMKDAEAMEKKYEPLTKAMEEFTKIAESNPIGKKLANDKAFEEELKKEFDLPDDWF